MAHLLAQSRERALFCAAFPMERRVLVARP